MFKKHICIAALACITLTACKPEVELEIRQNDLETAAASQAVHYVDFEAEISSPFTTIDDKKRAEIAHMERVLNDHFPEAEVDVSFKDKGFEIEIEGELPIVAGKSEIGTPWGVRVFDLNTTPKQYSVYLAKGAGWSAFAKDMNDAITFPRTPDFLEVTMKLRDFKGTIYGGGFSVDGTALSGYGSAKVDGTRVTLSFEGDHWNKAASGFLFISD